MQSPQKIQSEYNISIDARGLGDTFDALSEKYADSPKASLTQNAEKLLEQRIINDQELARKTEELYNTLAKKNREIEKYALLLESLEPVPGVNPEKILKIIESRAQAGNDITADYRDVKIVSLAKKSRALNLSLMKEKDAFDKKSAECNDWVRQVWF